VAGLNNISLCHSEPAPVGDEPALAGQKQIHSVPPSTSLGASAKQGKLSRDKTALRNDKLFKFGSRNSQFSETGITTLHRYLLPEY